MAFLLGKKLEEVFYLREWIKATGIWNRDMESLPLPHRV
jgi:hypothetical protein